jgi:hypothetical protein
MGFNVLLDIIGSVIIGGMLLLILFRLSDSATENAFNYTGELTSQQNLSTVVQILEHDFRKIGYCADWQKIPDPTKSILEADSNKIKFISDLLPDGHPDGNIDTVTYYLGPASELASTPNPNDRLLYRVINGISDGGVNLGVTEFKLIYFDALGDTIPFPIAVPGAITSMEINIAVENTSGYDNKYSSVFWRQIRLAARNLKNR